MASSNLRIKLLIDSSSKKVLYAVAGKDVVDFLFYIMSMPVGTLIRLVRKQGKVGCLTNLYESIESLDESYIQPNQKKDTLLNPRSSITAANFPLLPSDSPTKDLQLYCSTKAYCYCVTDVRGTTCACGNGRALTEKCRLVGSIAAAAASSTSEGGFVKGVVTYMVMDDLTVQPMSIIASITLLNKLNVKKIGCLQEKVVNFGMDKAIKLLKASFRSKAVLTDTFA